jgi:LuxR family transcriptional regulator, maltose regulon positive regulatory protein
MPQVLLATKFNIPAAGMKIVRRLRLSRLLDESLDEKARLVLVSAPAGYGKTTAISDWIRTSHKLSSDQFAWLTLERGDDDLARFLAYFIAALQKVYQGFGGGVLNLLRTHKPVPVQDLAIQLINELIEIPGIYYLVLDDYHLLSSKTIQDFISFLVDHQPPQMRLVLITRADPALPLARLRARGQLIELRQADLYFLPSEVAEFANKVMALDLCPEQVALLGKQTEGWISGLQLAIISMREVPDRSAYLKSFSGEHEFIADYLAGEVLASLPDAIRTFLLQTSILERLSASLCEAVTGQSGAQVVLEGLVAANLFIVPIDNQQKWYRYHTLFADLLRKRLHSTDGEMAGDLHDRASKWFEENAMFDLAVEHAISGENFSRAAFLIEQVAEGLLMHGQTSTLLRWLEALPEAEMIARPHLSAYFGVSLIVGGRPIRTVASFLEKMKETDGTREYRGEKYVLQAFLAVLQGNAALTVELSEQALLLLPSDRLFFRSLAADTLGMGNTLAGDIPAAVRAFEQVVEISQMSDNLMMTITALGNLAGLQYLQGYLRAAKATCLRVLELVVEHTGQRLPMTGKVLLTLGEIAREQGDLDAAFHYFQNAADLIAQSSEIGLSIAHISIARLMVSRKDWISAQKYIDTARRLSQETQSTKMDDELVEIVQAWLWIKQGEVDRAAYWARERDLLDRSPAKLIAAAGDAAVNELFQGKTTVLIRLYLAHGQPEQAGELIDWLTEINRKRGYKRREVEFLVLRALAWLLIDETDLAIDALAEALKVGEAEGYFLTFVQEGKPMARLLYLAIQQKKSLTYASKLLNAVLSGYSDNAEFENRVDELVEKLSERELEVLHLIADGLSNAEIAQRLYISLSTVKGHTANIYGKLGVKNRTQAVARARSFGLLEPSCG